MIPSSRVKNYRHFERRDENYALLGYYAASSGNFLLMFQENTMIPSSRVKSHKHFERKEENYALLGYYAASGGNSIQNTQNNQSVPSSRVKMSLEKGPIGCPKTLVRNYHYLLCNSPVQCSSPLLYGRSLKITHVGRIVCLHFRVTVEMEAMGSFCSHSQHYRVLQTRPHFKSHITVNISNFKHQKCLQFAHMMRNM